MSMEVVWRTTHRGLVSGIFPFTIIHSSQFVTWVWNLKTWHKRFLKLAYLSDWPRRVEAAVWLFVFVCSFSVFLLKGDEAVWKDRVWDGSA